MNIDFRENIMEIDGKVLVFPMSVEEVEGVLGKTDRVERESENCVKYIYDAFGIVFEAKENNSKWFKARKVYTDDAHNIIAVDLYCGNVVRPQWVEKILPESVCKAQITENGRKLWFISDRAETGDLKIIRWSDKSHGTDGCAKQIADPLSISFYPKKPHGNVSYKLKKCKEEVLEFDNLNFKLTIIQVLMYDLEVLAPYFDIYDFAEQYSGRKIDTESIRPIRPALNFFTKLPIPKSLAEQVEEICMDGGNDIYMNIIPQWDGEDGYFDLNALDERELKQFPNLKKATIMSEKYDEVAKVFTDAGIEVRKI